MSEAQLDAIFDPMFLRALRNSVGDFRVHDWARVAAKTIVDRGGIVDGSNGTRIYKHRVDWRIPMEVFDITLRRPVQVRVRLRITVEETPLESI